MRRAAWAALLAAACCWAAAAGKKEARPVESPLDRYVREAEAGSAAKPPGTPGSIWSASSRLADGARDPRAAQVDDVLTILVAERASALVKGTVKSSRSSSAKNSIAALAGITRATGPLANLAGVTGDTQLAGEGTTSRETDLSTTMTARVTHVLPSGAMLVEGSKEVQVNSDRQVVTVRGVVRPPDIGPGNVVSSDRLADLEIKVNGKGVVGDAIRRPFILYRILLGLLPF